MTQGSRHGSAATIMTEDVKTEKYTAGRPCGAYIEEIFLAFIQKLDNSECFRYNISN